MLNYRIYSCFLFFFLWVFQGQGLQAFTKDSLEWQLDANARMRLDAIHQLRQLGERAEKNSDFSRLYMTWRELGRLYQQNKQYPLARKVLEDALEVAEKHIGGKEEKLFIFYDLALNYQYEERYKLAQDFFYRIIESCSAEESPQLLEDGYQGLGSLYFHIGDYEKALEFYTQSLKYCRLREYLPGMVKNLCLISQTYLELENFDFALSQIREAQQLSNKLDDTVLRGDVYYKFGSILEKRLNTTRAIAKYLEALHLFESAEEAEKIATTLLKIGVLYNNSNRRNLSLEYFTRLEPFKYQLNPERFALLYFCYGEIWTHQGKADEAIKAFKECLAICKANGLKEQSQKAHHELFELYHDEESFDVALTHLERFVNLNDSIYDARKIQQITQLQFKYDLERSEKAIHALQLQQNRLMLIGFTIIAIAAIIGLSFIWRMRVRNNMALRKKNAEIKSQNTKLQESNVFLKQFAYVAAHDLKEPLRNIGSFINLLQKRYGGQFNEEAREYMGFVTNGAKRMNSLLVDLLEYSRISSEEAVREPLNIREVVEEICNNLKGQIDSKQANVYCSPGMPEIPMSRLHLTQLLQNLISNALKFSENAPVIRINAYQRDGQIILNVKDNGIGINKEFEHKVFNLFQVLDKRKHYEGTGIGLTICKNIVDKYDGQIWFDSRLGEGTTFFVSIPQEEQVNTLLEHKAGLANETIDTYADTPKS
ncbi:MAG: ATP-binding protein [Bacteroidota bacterium]